MIVAMLWESPNTSHNKFFLFTKGFVKECPEKSARILNNTLEKLS